MCIFVFRVSVFVFCFVCLLVVLCVRVFVFVLCCCIVGVCVSVFVFDFVVCVFCRLMLYFCCFVCLFVL